MTVETGTMQFANAKRNNFAVDHLSSLYTCLLSQNMEAFDPKPVVSSETLAPSQEASFMLKAAK